MPSDISCRTTSCKDTAQSPKADLTEECRLADDFASAGYTTIIPDIFRGDPVPADALSPAAKEPFDLMGWIGKHPPEKVEPVMDAAIKTLKEEYGVKKIGAVGYCFGGRYVVRYLGRGQIDAGVCCSCEVN